MGGASEEERWRDLDKLLARPGNIVSPIFEPSAQVNSTSPTVSVLFSFNPFSARAVER